MKNIKNIKDIRYNISLYILLPIIFAGIALLTLVASYNLTIYYQKAVGDPVWHVAFWGVFLVLFSVISGVLIVRFIIDPMERFVKKTDTLGVVNAAGTEDKHAKKDEMTRYTRMFDRVTDFLSRVEARELFPRIVGQSKSMRAVFYQIIKVAPTDSTVMLLGETGTGKELFASSIHEHSRRKGKPFVAINCAAIPEGLLESELFGHEKGAFTGADKRKTGKLEIAGGGTIFLDEIGDMPLAIQAKVLRAIEESRIERVGGTQPVKVDVRLIAATNKDLSVMVETGQFREDLFFRLNVFTVRLPRLKERREDIPILIERFLKQSEKHLSVSSETMQLLTAYDWPGNVRELKNAVESACILAKDVIEPVHLPDAITDQWGSPNDEKPDFDENRNLDDRIMDFERGMITEALIRAGGVQVTAARLLGVSERSLWHRVKKFDIDVDQYKRSGS
ncbi:MAG: sigma-54-dependent Fis family transcriptional regulator [Deltaproteobacteria bacterium]|nr:sigma-54-dependent Fis family transcriptional regulator [Deltaproteobacteria bacterium]